VELFLGAIFVAASAKVRLEMCVQNVRYLSIVKEALAIILLRPSYICYINFGAILTISSKWPWNCCRCSLAEEAVRALEEASISTEAS
jgi:hypothetical protein